MEVYDIVIIGSGVAGTFAAYKIAQENKKLKCLLLDVGRPPGKRRKQTEGFLGCLPNSDGKFYLSNLDQVINLIGKKQANSAFKFVKNTFDQVSNTKIIKDTDLFKPLSKKLDRLGWEVSQNNFFQTFPKEIHALSKIINSTIENSKLFEYRFDEEVLDITKENGLFVIQSEYNEYKCKKVLISVGRSSWRWAQKIYSKFGLIQNNDIARFGLKVEMPAQCLKNFNKSHCTLKKDNITIGPFSWMGTIIQEDQIDMSISSFRSNEDRWNTDKVSFDIIGDIETKDKGFEQTERIGKLTCILLNDRVMKDKVSAFMAKKGKISIINDYDWLIDVINNIAKFIPDLPEKGYYYVPTIVPMVSEINVGDNLETEVPGMFVAGESARIPGLLGAAVSGVYAANCLKG